MAEERPRWPNGLPKDLTAEEAIELLRKFVGNFTGIDPLVGEVEGTPEVQEFTKLIGNKKRGQSDQITPL